MWHLQIALVHPKTWNTFPKRFHCMPVVALRAFTSSLLNMQIRGNPWCGRLYSYAIWGDFQYPFWRPWATAWNTSQDMRNERCWKIRSIDLWRIVKFLIAEASFFHRNIVTKPNFFPKHFIFALKHSWFNMGLKGAEKLHHETLRKNEPEPQIWLCYGICLIFLRAISLFCTEIYCRWTFYWLCSTVMQK